MQGFKASVREPAIKRGGDGSDGVLEEGELVVERRGVEGRSAHEDVLDRLLVFCPEG